ncbi:Acyl-CoA reductase (LuxC) [Ruminococcaceae bacterium YAD3003]|nr:Acyl-CoA reductase (LuxC) [Ruminococcaceae bacterium YAD3003]
MQINLKDRIKYLTGDESILEKSDKIPALPMFSDIAVGFLADLSKELLSIPNIREHLDVMSYAYWIRKASIEKEKQKYNLREYRLGRGVAFHIAPSNVPVNFAVSMTSSLLAGNITVIRVSNKEFVEVSTICDAINRVLAKEEFAMMRSYICIIRYEHSDEITAFLSSICDVRIIWGGNNTIAQIRKYPIPPRAIEMCFADRHSVAIIDPEKYLEEDPSEIAKKFYTDTYYSDQNACSSPRIVIWLGENEAAKTSFWNALNEEVKSRYEIQPVQVIDKLSTFTEISMKMEGVRIREDISADNRLMVIDIPSLVLDSETIMDYKMNSGYFYQYTATCLDDILPILNKTCQTIAVLGIEKKDVVSFLMEKGVRGIDRVVDIGDTMGLEFVWDGFKMIENMSRIVYIYEK